jgi:hypothetical protein
VEKPDFAERAANVREGAKKIWTQDIPVNLGVQTGKGSRFVPHVGERDYGPLETTLLQFNAWLVGMYRRGAGMSVAPEQARRLKSA